MKKFILTTTFVVVLVAPSVQAINIVVDYTYDTNNFFDTPTKKAAMQAAADRFSNVITSSLLAVGPGGTGTGTSAGWRVGFTHPGTGASFELSTAASFATDPFSGAGAADVYGFSGLNANQWILYAGGRALGSAGIGGTGTGINTTTTFDDISGPMHRGFADNTPASSINDLPRWGGAVTFNSGEAWNFSLGSTGSGLDFYSIALHEVGHALGLSTSWNQWNNTAGVYTGPLAIAAYNTDNGTSLTGLNLESAANPHWKDNTYDSFIFGFGNPNTVGTVPGGTKQDLVMEPIADFGGAQNRFELTNVDVAALQDLGWSVIPEPTSGLLFAFGVLPVFLLRRR